MNKDEAIVAEGKASWRLLSLAAIGLCAGLLIEQIIAGQSWKISLVQGLILVLQAILAKFVGKGKIKIWWYFITLMFAGIWAFVIGGSQMGDFTKNESMAMTYLLVSVGLAIFALAIYSVYSPAIEMYLKGMESERNDSSEPS